MANVNYTPAPDVAAAESAQAQGQADAQRRQDYYGARPGEGVPVSTGGASPELLAFLEDRAVTGTHSVPGTVTDA